MIHQRAPDQITAWSVAFFEGRHYRFARFVPGRFKHCLAFGYSEACRTWVVYDIAFVETRIYVLPDGPWGKQALAEWLDGATILTPKKHDSTTARRRSLGFGFYCVPAIAHLVGSRCGAGSTPTGLYRRMIAEGAEVIHGQQLSAIRPTCPT